MSSFKVLIGEDNPIIAIDLEHELTRVGCDVCGVAASEVAARSVAEATRLPFAVAFLPKPYSPSDIPAAREAISQIRAGLRPESVPDHMKVLTR